MMCMGNSGWGGNSCLWIVLILILVCCCGCGSSGNSCGCGCNCGCGCGCNQGGSHFSDGCGESCC